MNGFPGIPVKIHRISEKFKPDFQSGSLSIYYRISKVVHSGGGGKGVDISWNSIGLYKIPLEKENKAFYRLHISISVAEIIYKLS